MRPETRSPVISRRVSQQVLFTSPNERATTERKQTEDVYRWNRASASGLDPQGSSLCLVKPLLSVAGFDWQGTDPVATFLFELAENHGLSNAMFLVDDYGYRIPFFHHEFLRGERACRISFPSRTMSSQYGQTRGSLTSSGVNTRT